MADDSLALVDELFALMRSGRIDPATARVWLRAIRVREECEQSLAASLVPPPMPMPMPMWLSHETDRTESNGNGYGNDGS